MTDFTTKRITKQIAAQLHHAMEGDWDSLSSSAAAVHALAEGLKMGKLAEAGAYETNSPLGFDTVIGYATRHAPVIIQWVPNLKDFLLEQEAVLIAACIAQQTTITSVTAPDSLSSLGVDRCHAFPEVMLRAHFEV